MKQELKEEKEREEGIEIKGREIDTQVQEDAKYLAALFSGIMPEISKINKQQEIEEITGFSDELE